MQDYDKQQATDYLTKVGLLESERNSNSVPSAMDDSSDGGQLTAPQSAEDTVSDTKLPTDTVTGVAKPKRRSNTEVRIRTVFSEDQKRQLLHRFHRQSYISPRERAELAKALGLSCKQVKTWYQNRRMKMKRTQYGQNPANSWNQPNFSAVSSQSFPLVQTLSPGQVQGQGLSYGQETFHHNGQVLPFGAQNPPLENPVSEVRPPHSMHQQFQNSSASFHLQISQLPTRSDCYFGNYSSGPAMIPEVPSATFTNQIPGSSTGHPSVGVLPIPTFEDELPYIALPSSYRPTGAECSYPSGAGVAGSSQDAYVYQNNLCSMQSGSSPGQVMSNPMLDTSNTKPFTLAKPIGQSFIG
ncbi:homeotic protein distal-less-like [Hypanus sabinus]|uniref:homeotic protein distal-less-like n=1 Tax=Hypanus sabinus TaxID=79690 RepID=UPI0028C3D5C5|nr:homeotic protein distal-less-like [Hypanus sabinus]